MAFARDLRATPADLSARADADVLRAGLVGVDVMRVAVPQRTTFRELVRGVGDTVRVLPSPFPLPTSSSR